MVGLWLGWLKLFPVGWMLVHLILFHWNYSLQRVFGQLAEGGQDGRVVKAPSFGGERTKYTPDMPGSNPAAKKSIGWADGTEVTSRRYYGWHRPHFWAAGWQSG